MTLEEKIKYYTLCYIDEYNNQLPEGINVKDFFTLDFLEWLLEKNNYKKIWSNELSSLFEIAYNDPKYMEIITKIFLTKDISLNRQQFDYIMNYKSMGEKFIQTIVKYINGGLKNWKGISIKLILSNPKTLHLILNTEINNIDFLQSVFGLFGIEKNVYLTLLSDEKFKKAFLNLNYLEFFDFINKFSLENDIPELISEKIQTLKYEEIINLLEKKYDVENNIPEYLTKLYYNYETEFKNNKIKQLICSLKLDSNEELKGNVKNILNTKDGMNIFLSEIIEPKFSAILTTLNMGSEYKTIRKYNLLDKLNNYEQYDLNTIKNLFSLYCFDDISYNTKLRLKTILEYAKEDEEIKEKYSREVAISFEIYKFLISEDLTINPSELAKYGVNLDINLIIRELHSKFSHDVNQKTNILNILKERTDNSLVNDGTVKVYDLSNLPVDQSYFLIHATSVDALKDNPLEEYKTSSKNHNRICMSLFDNNHIASFLSNNTIVFGYCNINNPIYSATTFDGQTNQQSDFVSLLKPQQRSTLTNIKKFMDRTDPKSYNELTYFTDKNLVMPSYIFVSNREPAEVEYKMAKEFNIPIVVYRTKEIPFEYEESYADNNREYFDYYQHSINIIPSNVKENNKKL